MKPNFGMEVLESVKCAVGVCGKRDLGVDVFSVSEFVIKCDSKNFTILCVRNLIVVMSNWLKTCTGSDVFIEYCNCALL